MYMKKEYDLFFVVSEYKNCFFFWNKNGSEASRFFCAFYTHMCEINVKNDIVTMKYTSIIMVSVFMIKRLKNMRLLSSLHIAENIFSSH